LQKTSRKMGERQYLSSTGEGKPARYQRMLDLTCWLKEHVPTEDSVAGPGAGLVRGDYRFDNLVFHPTEDRVIGVLLGIIYFGEPDV
jgi:acyl-CoA dehydrogenase